MATIEDLGDRLRDALAEIAFDASAPAQARVAALKELRDVLREDRDGPRDGPETDPGTLSLDDIERELRLSPNGDGGPPPGTKSPTKSST